MIGVVIGATIGVLTVATLVKAHATRVRVPRIGRWRTPPPVVVDRTCPVPIRRVERAARWWRKLGYELGEVREGTAFYPVGTIVLRGGATPEGKIGHEELDIDGGGNLESAVCTLDGSLRLASDREQADAVLHLLGHCLGYLHAETPIVPGIRAEKSGHVMHPMSGRNHKGMSPDDPVDRERLKREKERARERT